jgi:hypothetical protein
MALYYTLQINAPHGATEEGMWHVGTEISDLGLDDAKCVEVQADGHELEAIKAKFTGIPMANNRVVRWTGETAHFIYQHLNY